MCMGQLCFGNIFLKNLTEKTLLKEHIPYVEKTRGQKKGGQLFSCCYHSLSLLLVLMGHSVSNQPIFRKFQKLMSQNLLKF